MPVWAGIIYLRQNPGKNKVNTVKISSRPTIIKNDRYHFATIGKADIFASAYAPIDGPILLIADTARLIASSNVNPHSNKKSQLMIISRK